MNLKKSKKGCEHFKQTEGQPQWTQSSKKTEDTKDTKDPGALASPRDDDVYEGNDHQRSVHHIPSIPEVRTSTIDQANGNDLETTAMT